MRKMTIFILPVLLAGCGQSSPQDEPDPRLLNFPGLEWGMTPDEVRAVHPLKDEKTLEESLNFADHLAFHGEMEFFNVEGATSFSISMITTGTAPSA